MHHRLTTPLHRVFSSLICLPLICGALLSPGSHAVTEDLKIPNLGESSTSLFSADYEYQLGRMWLRSFRGQAPLLNDPLMHSYLENLVFELVQHSELQDRRIELVIVDNPTINAFAVPGGVIGVHSGLFQYAETEDEFATVMAHEIAHLSQRHFSRRMELAQEQGPMQLAGLLAGVLLAATRWHRRGSRSHDDRGRGSHRMRNCVTAVPMKRKRTGWDCARCTTQVWTRTRRRRCSNECMPPPATVRATASPNFSAPTPSLKNASPIPELARCSIRSAFARSASTTS